MAADINNANQELKNTDIENKGFTALVLMS